MGQCSSTSKQRPKPESLESFDNPALEEEESSDGIVEPQLSGMRQQRRAIDERTGKKEQAAFGTEGFGLAGLRPSLDDTTCTALLALRMGRGSSVGGLLSSVASGPNIENAQHHGEGCSPKAGAKPLDSLASKCQLLWPPVLGKAQSLESNEPLEELLVTEGANMASVARQPPKIPGQG